MDDNKQDQPVEYVEAEYLDATPIESTHVPVGQEPPVQPHVYTYYHRSDNCIPCCGPFGCATLLLIALLLIGNPELFQGALFAIAILVVVSVISRLVIRRP